MEPELAGKTAAWSICWKVPWARAVRPLWSVTHEFTPSSNSIRTTPSECSYAAWMAEGVSLLPAVRKSLANSGSEAWSTKLWTGYSRARRSNSLRARSPRLQLMLVATVASKRIKAARVALSRKTNADIIGKIRQVLLRCQAMVGDAALTRSIPAAV